MKSGKKGQTLKAIILSCILPAAPLPALLQSGCDGLTGGYLEGPEQVNNPPIIGEIPESAYNATVGKSYMVDLTGGDPEGEPCIWGFANPDLVPEGMNIYEDDGLILWTPNDTQGEQTYTITVTLSDGDITSSKTWDVYTSY